MKHLYVPAFVVNKSGTSFFHASIFGTVQRKKIVTERDLATVAAVRVKKNRGSSS
jgi:hypothetical protein